MNIFNAKLVDRNYLEKLEKKLRETEHERDKYISKTAELVRKLDEIGKLEETILEGCVKGPWCKACEFVKTFHYSEPHGLYGVTEIGVVYACSKGETCENFVAKTE